MKKREVIDPATAGGESKVDKLLGEIGDNMRRIEKLLEDKDTSAQTTATQAKTVDLIEKLIEEANKT